MLSRKENLILCRVQHHHAHIASCMAENHLTEKVIGVSFDGTGLGDDGKIWGGEFLIANYYDYKRVGHLKYQAMPGGEQVIHYPWRMAFSYIYSNYGTKISNLDIGFIKQRKRKEINLLEQMLIKNINSPSTSSCGRLFDAVSALIGLKEEVSFEGQAAIQLESICQSALDDNYSFRIEKELNKWIINTEEMFRQIVFDLKNNVPKSTIATKFHNTVAEFTTSMCKIIREKTLINEVVLSGGVFQNSYLLEQTIKKLKNNMFNIFIHKAMPPNDACISLGQAMVANAKENNF